MRRVTSQAAHGITALGVFALVVLLAPGDARAQASSADCSIYEIKASNTGEGTDADLKPLRKKLGRGPFKAWKRFQKLAIHTKALAHMRADETKLVPGKLSLLYKGTVQAKGRKDRVRLSLTIDDRSDKRVVDTGIEQDSGDFFLIVDGRLRIPGGDYVFALSCVAK